MTGWPPGPWPFVSGATVQGSDHRAVARGNEDAFRAAVPADRESVVIAVADGAGGQQRGALGAQFAVDAACRMLLLDRPPRRPGHRLASLDQRPDHRHHRRVPAHGHRGGRR